MIEARCIETNEIAYIPPANIETHDADIDQFGFITFYDCQSHKYYRTELPWEHGLDEFIQFVDNETNSSEMDDVA
jgi:hypothetical protein